MRIYREELERELENNRLAFQNKILKIACVAMVIGYILWIIKTIN